MSLRAPTSAACHPSAIWLSFYRSWETSWDLNWPMD
jgi:hypothetical protein